MKDPRRLWAWAQDPRRDLEAVIETNSFVAQKARGGLVALGRGVAPGPHLVFDKG